jgi:transposase
LCIKRLVSEDSQNPSRIGEVGLERIGLEAGPLSQWLYAALREGGLAVELLETRHVKAALSAMPVKTDRNDARGIAQLMRLGWFRPVHSALRPGRAMVRAGGDLPNRRLQIG